MIKHIASYFAELAAAFGRGWTQFWFTPSDPSVLCAMRLLTGLIVVYLHATLGIDLLALFGPDGMLPSADIAPLDAGRFSYLNYLRTPAELWTAHLIGLAILVMFAAGFWTRLTAVLALLVFLSDVHRAPMITSRTESLCAMVMLYLCIGPSGARYSIDRLLARRAHATTSSGEARMLATTATIATRLIQVHLALVVAMMGFSMLAGEVWWTGDGAWWLLAREESRLVDFTWLHASPKLIALWTHVIVLFSLAFPILVWVRLARPLLLAGGVVVWTSLALITGEATFALMMIVASLAFVSPDVWNTCCGSATASVRPSR